MSVDIPFSLYDPRSDVLVGIKTSMQVQHDVVVIGHGVLKIRNRNYRLSIHFFTSSFVWPVFFWIRPYSSSSFPSSYLRSSSVRLAQRCLALPFSSFQLPFSFSLVLILAFLITDH